MKTYELLGIKVQTLPEYLAKEMILSFINSDSQHQIVTVNPEFIVSAQSDEQFFNIINQASLATIDGAGIIKALQYYGHDVSLQQRLTGVRLTEILTELAEKNNLKILFILNSLGLTKQEILFGKIKEKYPQLEFMISTEKEAVDKAQYFQPEIALVGLGAPRQDIWIAENISRMPSVRVAVGIGGTFDFMSQKVRRAPKIMRSMGLEWLWRFSIQPRRFRRIYRAIIIFPYLIFRNKPKKV